MRLFDFTTMPLDHAFNWDPNSIVGQGIINEDWKGVNFDTKQAFLEDLMSCNNDDTFVSKLLDFKCFLAVAIRDNKVYAKMIVLENFQRFLQGPIFYGPYNWPDNRL